MIFEEEGEVLFRSYGLSGIVIFNASRYAEPGNILLLDLMPHFTAEVLREMFLKRLEQQRDAVARFLFLLGLLLTLLPKHCFKRRESRVKKSC